MSHVRAKLVFALLACAASTAGLGCSMPLAGALPAASEHATARQATSPANTQAAQESQKPPSDAEPNMAAVFDTMLAIRKIDPTAEAKLVAELQRTPSESWPLVAEQFRASLAYREQLKTTSGKPNESPTRGKTDTVTTNIAQHEATATDSRPSEAFGALLDPRRADKEDVGLVDEQLSNAMPAVLAEAAAPIQSAYDPAIQQAAADGGDGAVIQAKLETATSPESPSKTPPEEPNPIKDDADWQALVKRAMDDLNGRVAPSPTTTAEVHQHVSLRLLRLLAGDTEKALEPIPHIGPVEQDYWSRQLFALAIYLDHHSQPDDKRRAAASVVHLDESVSNLRELGTLTLRNLTFCKNVYGYGAIDPYEKDDFSPGERVSLYVEVENYHSQSTEKGFHTLLGSSYELLNEAGQRVGGEEFPDVDDYCRSRRRDFHVQFGIALPEKLAAETHRVRVIVKDRQSEKMATSEAVFNVRGAVGKSSSEVEAVSKQILK